MIGIIGTHLDEMINQDGRNEERRNNMKSSLPCTANTQSKIINSKMVTPPMLSNEMKAEAEYTLFHLTNTMMGIDKNITADRKVKSKRRKKFSNNIQFDFPVGLFPFKRYGCVADWTVAVRMKKGR